MNWQIEKSAYKGTFTIILNQCEQNQNTSLVHITKNCELCLQLKIWLVIEN